MTSDLTAPGIFDGTKIDPLAGAGSGEIAPACRTGAGSAATSNRHPAGDLSQRDRSRLGAAPPRGPPREVSGWR
jgi:hypothetical protein